jgi:hypothetical protein
VVNFPAVDAQRNVINALDSTAPELPRHCVYVINQLPARRQLRNELTKYSVPYCS